MAFVDWLIVAGMLAIMLVGVMKSRQQTRSVADFLAAGRTAGRYLLSVAGGIAGLGAISIVRDLEMNYIAGFSLGWWGLTMGAVVLIVTVSGWVIYRFRQTRCMTLAEFFERRYSRRFRIFAGIVVFGAGIVNFGIFPAVGARFFIHYLEIPPELTFFPDWALYVSPPFLLSIPTFPLMMIVLLGISLFFVFNGGQIAVMLTDFLQGLFVNIVFVAVVIYMLALVGWDRLFLALGEAPQNKSLINPFDTGHIQDFNFWFFLIGVVGFLYCSMAWQGTQAYNVSAKSAHEAKMGGVLGMWRGFPQGIFLMLVPMLIYTVMHHADFAETAAGLSERLSGIGTDLTSRQQSTLHNQLRGPLALAALLPSGLIGAFAAVMLAAFISTHDTYLHSWGSVFVQDVVIPLRKKPLTEKQHLRLLRISIVGVLVFIFGWSMFFQLSEAIALYFAVTGAIIAGGSGAVIIGGLYTRWGTTPAAWGALITGSSLAVGRILFHQFVPVSKLLFLPGVNEVGPAGGLYGMARWFHRMNGQECWALTMAAALVVYVLLSLLGERKRFDLDRLLHRGEHARTDEMKIITENPARGWRMLGMGREFTVGDKLLYLASYVWTGLWTLVFIVGTIYNLAFDGTVSDAAWEKYWRVFIYIQLVLAVVVIVWFSIGGFFDIRGMFKRLRERTRDDADDGFVREEP